LVSALPVDSYANYNYYGKWATSLLQVLLRKGLLNEKSVFLELYGDHATQEQLFVVGDTVKVLQFNTKALFRRPHLRTPGYLFGKKGIIQSLAGRFLPPEQVSWNFDAKLKPEPQPCYRVRFRLMLIQSLPTIPLTWRFFRNG
jgi:nitrile hydratase subunit alpha